MFYVALIMCLLNVFNFWITEDSDALVIAAICGLAAVLFYTMDSVGDGL